MATWRVGAAPVRVSVGGVAHLVPARRALDDGARSLVRRQTPARPSAGADRAGRHATERGHLRISDRPLTRIARRITGWKGLPRSFVDKITFAVAETMRV